MSNYVEVTAKEVADKLWMDCYPNEIDNGRVVKDKIAKKYAKIACDTVIKETITEYTNDENHCRIEFWQEVKKEIDLINPQQASMF